MSKFMSVLEKMRVVEKVNGENPDGTSLDESNNINQMMPQKIDNKQGQAESNIKPFKMPNNNDNKPMQDKSKYEKNKTIDEIYSAYDLGSSNINTIFMLGNFINALPENLPYAVKRSSVTSIINASNTNLNVLINDGEKRLKVLEQFANDYSAAVSNIIVKNKEEIKKLKQMIEYYEAEIQIKETMLEEQNNIIKYETQRINNIIGFFRKEE